jgi:uncharacterized protein YegL
MTMSVLAGEVDVAYPQQPHVPTVLLLDVSKSMKGEPIAAMSQGFLTFLQETARDPLAAKRVDLAVVTFGGAVTVAHSFAPVGAYSALAFEAKGRTPMGEAIAVGMRMLEERKAQYRSEGTDYYRPWLFLITDGEPTDMAPGDEVWNRVTGALQLGIRDRRFAFFAVGTGDANMETLKAICGPASPPLRLRGMAFRELFFWLSCSQRQVSASQVGEQVAPPLPAPGAWADIN